MIVSHDIVFMISYRSLSIFACTIFLGNNIQGKKMLQSRVITKIKHMKIKWTKILLGRRARDVMELEEFRVDILCSWLPHLQSYLVCSGQGSSSL